MQIYNAKKKHWEKTMHISPPFPFCQDILQNGEFEQARYTSGW